MSIVFLHFGYIHVLYFRERRIRNIYLKYENRTCRGSWVWGKLIFYSNIWMNFFQAMVIKEDEMTE